MGVFVISLNPLWALGGLVVGIGCLGIGNRREVNRIARVALCALMTVSLWGFVGYFELVFREHAKSFTAPRPLPALGTQSSLARTNGKPSGNGASANEDAADAIHSELTVDEWFSADGPRATALAVQTFDVGFDVAGLVAAASTGEGLAWSQSRFVLSRSSFRRDDQAADQSGGYGAVIDLALFGSHDNRLADDNDMTFKRFQLLTPTTHSIRFAQRCDHGWIVLTSPSIDATMGLSVGETQEPDHRLVLLDATSFETVAETMIAGRVVNCELVANAVVGVTLAPESGLPQRTILFRASDLNRLSDALPHTRHRIMGPFADGWIRSGMLYDAELEKPRLLLELPGGEPPVERRSLRQVEFLYRRAGNRPGSRRFSLNDVAWTVEEPWLLARHQSPEQSDSANSSVLAECDDRTHHYQLVSFLPLKVVATAHDGIDANVATQYLWAEAESEPQPGDRVQAAYGVEVESIFSVAGRYAYAGRGSTVRAARTLRELAHSDDARSAFAPVTPLPVVPRQSTMELSMQGVNRLHYDLPGVRQYYLKLYLGRDSPTDAIEQTSTDGHFQIQISEFVDQIADRCVAAARQYAALESKSGRLASWDSDASRRLSRGMLTFAKSAQAGYEVTMGQTTERIPVNVFA
ncbi:MAG: hypothetical protein AAGA03_18870, partial [Planctomycetota bacterium]